MESAWRTPGSDLHRGGFLSYFRRCEDPGTGPDSEIPRQVRRGNIATDGQGADHVSDQTVTSNAQFAAPRGIATGAEVSVGNARGSFEALAAVSDRVRPGVVATPKGRWLRDAKGGATVNATVDERDSDMGGGAVYHDNRVEVKGVAGRP